jgi:endoglucanase
MDSSAREFLWSLLHTPSPSGYEQPVQRLVRDYLKGSADTLTTDSHGNVIAGKAGPAASGCCSRATATRLA